MKKMVQERYHYRLALKEKESVIQIYQMTLDVPHVI